MGKNRDLRNESSAPAHAPESADAVKSIELFTDASTDRADAEVLAEVPPNPEPPRVDPPLTPEEAEPDEDHKVRIMAPEARAEALDGRPTLAELHKAAHEGREVEISKAVDWAGPDVEGIYVDGSWRRHYVASIANIGEAALNALATNPTILVRFVE